MLFSYVEEKIHNNRNQMNNLTWVHGEGRSPEGLDGSWELPDPAGTPEGGEGEKERRL